MLTIMSARFGICKSLQYLGAFDWRKCAISGRLRAAGRAQDEHLKNMRWELPYHTLGRLPEPEEFTHSFC
jgi:hypothetical protein